MKTCFVCTACNFADACDSTSFPRMCNLTDFVDTSPYVQNFLRRTKLVSSFIKEIYIKNCFVIFCLDRLIHFFIIDSKTKQLKLISRLNCLLKERQCISQFSYTLKLFKSRVHTSWHRNTNICYWPMFNVMQSSI